MPTRTSAPTGAPCWIDLGTPDQAASRAFYGELFGWTSDDPGPEFGGYVNFVRDGVMVAGCMQGEAGTTGWGVYLATPDIAETLAAVPEHGGAVTMPAQEVGDLGSMAFVTDPGGGTVGLWQPGQHAGFGVYGEVGSPTWFELHTSAYAPSVEFYAGACQWDARTMADEPGFRYTTYGEGEDALAGIMDASVYLPEGASLAEWSIYFGVDDADKTVAQAQSLGATVIDQPEDTPYGRLATLADPHGARFKIMQDITGS